VDLISYPMPLLATYRRAGQTSTGGVWRLIRSALPRASGPRGSEDDRRARVSRSQYRSSHATQLCMGTYVPFACLTTLGYFSLRSREASRRKESRQFVSDLCPTPSTDRQLFIANSSRSLRCTHKQGPPPSRCGHEVLGGRKKNANQEM